MRTARHLGGVVGYVSLFAAFLFLPAGTGDWGRAWVLLAVLLVVRGIGTVSVLRANSGVVEERAKPAIQAGQPMADRVLLLSFMATFAGVVAFNAVDVFHLHLLLPPNDFVAAGGLVMFAAGWWIVSLALRTNAFASRVVRHQEERHHTVVSHGVYQVVRHPMYAGLVSVMIGMSLWLGSYAAALLALVPIGILVIRIHVEEQLLDKSLAGYTEYASRVRWRMIPRLW